MQAGGASLSWFSPVSYTDLEIRNERGELLLALPKVSSERTLWDIVTHLNNLGTFRIERPQVSIVVRPDGSNLEDVFCAPPTLQKAPEPAPEISKAPAKLPTMAVEFVDGTIGLVDSAQKQKWEIDKFNFLLRTSADSPLPVEMKLTGQVPYAGRTAQLSISGEPAAGGGVDHIDAKIDALPLAMFRAFADRFGPGMQLQGTLATDLHVDGLASFPANALRISGGATVDNVSVTGGPLGADRFALAHVDLPCQLAYQNRTLTVDQLGVTSDVGQLTATGVIEFPEQVDSTLVGRLAQSTFNVNGQLDLVKLAALLPKTLHVREGAQITSGQVKLAIASKPDGANHVWTGQISASDLAAVHDGRRVAWDQPINLQFAARAQGNNYSLDQFAASASFLSLSAKGSLDGLQAEAQCDLDRLMNELSQFVDMGDARLAGRADSHLNWQRGANGAFQAAADLQLQALQIALPGRPPWQEDSLKVAANASGAADNLGLTASAPTLHRIDSAEITLTADNPTARTHEQVGVRLMQPIEQIAANTHWPIEVQMQSQLGRWWPRVAAWLKIDGLDLSGACDARAQAAYSPSGVEIQSLKGNINSLHAWGWNSLFVDEPVVQLDCSGNYDFASHKLTLNRSSLLTTSVSVQTDAATVALPVNAPLAMQGVVNYQADLARLLRWVSDPRTPPKYVLAGRLTGSANVSRTGTASHAQIENSIDDFAAYVIDDSPNKLRTGAPAAAQLPPPVWTEKKLTASIDGGWDQATDSVQLASLVVGSQALALRASGKIDSLSSKQNVDLAGTVDYDWQSIGPLLRPYLGSKITITGRQSRKFDVHGSIAAVAAAPAAVTTVAAVSPAGLPGGYIKSNPLAPANGDSFAYLRPLVANMSIGWTEANFYGMPVGALDLDAHLENGTVTTKPIRTAVGFGVSPGRLTMSPVVQLTPTPSEFILGKGTLLSNIQITQDMGKSWMKFVAPVLAECSRAEGSFSLTLDSAQIPLNNPDAADISGQLLVHDVSVTPGPFMRPLVLICQQLEALIARRPPPVDLNGNPVLVKIDDQKVDFRVVDGRVYHQGLSMQIGNTTVRTRGSVGADESLSLVAEVPLKREWMQGNSKLQSVPDQTIRIPITGTLSHPLMDGRVILQLFGATLENIGDKLESGLNKGLEKLLPQQR